jgi:competence ComEA-like helix-hairpin-helix protein
MTKDSSVLGAIGLITVILSLVALARIETQDRSNDSSPVEFLTTSADQKKADFSEAVKALREGRPMNLNQASAADLELLPRLGPKLAQRIVDDRQRNGPFETVNELLRVRGIGPVTFEKIAPMLTVSDKMEAVKQTN